MTTKPVAVLLGSGWGIPHNQALLINQFDYYIQTNNINQIKTSIETLENFIKQGYLGIGFLAYEAARAFGLPTQANNLTFSLCGFYIFRKYDMVDVNTLRLNHQPQSPEFLSSINPGVYHHTIQNIKHHIACGNTYQVNFTIRAKLHCDDDPLSIFINLYQAQPVPYAAYMRLGDEAILSMSPELFFQQNHPLVSCKPMKGTIKRGRFLQEDLKQTKTLKQSTKDQAENLMIVDMVRNDLGRICQYGTIQATKLFEIELYQTLLQMTSTVSGRLKQNINLYKILNALFPAASITGAPKKRTMELIRQYEDSPRGIYCGTIGFIQSTEQSIWNVAIRTLWGKCNQYHFAAGGGIVWDSVAENELQEVMTKTGFVTKQATDFYLFETILLNEQLQFLWLDDHLQRLQESAIYFAFHFPNEMIRQRIFEYKKSLPFTHPVAVKVILYRDGTIAITHRNLSTISNQVCVDFSTTSVNSQEIFLFHKTNQRQLYNTTREKALKRNVFETLFINEQGHITEGTISNVFCRIDQRWYTPPIEDGLLAGIWRKHFLIDQNAIEKSLTKSDLLNADEVIIGNSVMGMIKVDRISIAE